MLPNPDNTRAEPTPIAERTLVPWFNRKAGMAARV